MRALVALVLVVALAGCAQSGPPFESITEIEEGYVVIYAYLKTSAAVPLAHVRLHKYGSYSLKPGGYSYWKVRAGTHRISLRWASGSEDFQRRNRRRFKAAAGRSYYYRIEVERGPMRESWTFRPVDEEVALAELVECRRSDRRVPSI